jgi:dynein intermediate chain 2
LAHIYVKKRREFGKHPKFSEVHAEILESITSTDAFQANYIMRNPSIACFDTAPHMSEHEANTERLVTKSSSMRHVEGGWPKDVDATEQSDVSRFRKKAEKDEEYKGAVKALGPIIARCMRQINTIDIYEEYFNGDHVDHSSEPPSAKGLAVFRDPNDPKRTATSINWHPDPAAPVKLAVSYSSLQFQDTRGRIPQQSFIWDILNPNTPESELLPPSPLCCLRFNPKNTDTLIGGSYNGLITFYDLRRSGSSNPTGTTTAGASGAAAGNTNAGFNNSITTTANGSAAAGGGAAVNGLGSGKEVLPFSCSVIEKSHHDPVYDVFWINSKTGNQAVSVSTDGQMLWWDTRRLSEPSDSIKLSIDSKAVNEVVLGGSSLEYNSEAGPSKYLVGTEQGIVLLVNLKNRKQNNGITVFDQGPGKHHGPIYSIQRNPANSKCFLTVGDWTAKIWMEDLKTPIMTTKYHPSYLMAGCWSPTRAGVFFVTRYDGVLDIWDYFYRQNEVAYSHKVGDITLSSIAVQGTMQSGGKLVAIGDTQGTVSLLELCESLAVSQTNERKAIDLMFEREMKQEKNLEARERELKRLRAAENDGRARENQEKKDAKDEKMEALLRKVDADFLAMIKEAEDDESKAAEATPMDGNNPDLNEEK